MPMPEGWNDDQEKQFQQAFQTDPRYRAWFQSFLTRFGEMPNLNDPQYDYRRAFQAGVFPTPDPYDNNFPHWPSALDNGTMLKSADHPTRWMEEFMQRYGVNPEEGIVKYGIPEERLKGLLDQ